VSANEAAWREYRLAYEGGRPYIDRYLFQHDKERTKDYKVRVRRAVYPNHVGAVVDTYAAHLYREQIARQADSDTLVEMWADMDMLGTPADEFYEQVAQAVQVGGRCAVVVDRWDGESDSPILTRAQEQRAGRRPYAYLVGNEDLIDWEVDRRGRLLWVAVREWHTGEREPGSPHQASVEHMRVWRRDRWELWVEQVDEDGNGEVVKIDEQEHPVGEVPVTLFFWGRRQGEQPVATSALRDLAPMNRRLFNHISLIDEQIYQYVFSILVMPTSTWDVVKNVNWSVSGGIPVKDDARIAPHYIAPKVDQLAAIRSEVTKTEEKIRQLSGLGRVNEENKSVQTGIALSYLTLDKDALLTKFGGRMARGETSIDRHAQAWMGQAPSEVSRDYPTSFDPLDLQDELNNALKLISMGVQGEALVETVSQALRSWLGPKLSATELDRVLADLRTRLDTGGAPL
jgi:hypothetical protein